ncbi:uncharacterized protein LOC108244660 isoform X2 [Kryptolebias marmoratus]|uniref:uncharacterized protein LOC108244660 isoform X2 n=1 Tax=Kryptolebias marmoratus TaxID=37003 RepID=UPI0018AD0A5C|nr:uncharacterized protein LOC108244660 isoform X2 [Kryptolebias marmoratus]
MRNLMRKRRISLVFITVLLILLSWTFRSNETSPWTPNSRALALSTLPIQNSVSQIKISGNTVLPGQSASLLKVSVIAIVLRSENVSFHCHLRCQDQLHVSNGVKNTLKHHFNFPYGTAAIMCPLPPGCETPTHVAVTSATTKPEGFIASDHQFLEVKNQKELTGPFLYNFTVCFSTMFDFTNVLQLVQSLEMLQLLGVNRVVVYKTNCSADTQRVLDYYTTTGLVEVIPWSLSNYLNVSRGFISSKEPADLHYFGQISALNDFLYRYMYKSRYVALHDPDELILPQSVDSWLKLLPLLEKKFGADKCYMFENNVFPKDVVLPPPKPQPLPLQAQWENVSGVNILAHLYKEPTTAKFKWTRFKTIVNPRAVFSLTVHGVLSSQRGCVWINGNIARMYHTRSQVQKLTPDELIYDGRLLSYSTNLTPAVNTALRKIGLVPEGNTK